MAIVPANELRGRVAARQVFAGNAQLPIGLRTRGEDDRVVRPAQLLDGHIAPDRDIAQEGELGRLGDLVIDTDRLFELGVIRRDPAAYQPIRGGEPFEHIDADGVLRADERLGGVEAARSAPHDRYTQRILLRPKIAHVTVAHVRNLSVPRHSYFGAGRVGTHRVVRHDRLVLRSALPTRLPAIARQ